VSTKPTAPPAEPEIVPPGTPAGDIRSGRAYILRRGSLRKLARPLLRVAALVTLDLVALVVGIFAALTLREAWRGGWPPIWKLLWDREAEWLPFLAMITVLVFWLRGLYRSQELRGGVGHVLASLTLVAVITLAFGVGTGYRFHTYGLVPTALVICGVLMGLLRASFAVVTRDLWRLFGVRRRAILVGEGPPLDRLRRVLRNDRSGSDYELLGVVSPAESANGLPVLGALSALPRILGEHRVDELIVAESGFSERQLLEVVEHAHRRGVRVRVAPTATELLLQRAEFVPGQGTPLFELRPPAFAGADWALKRTFDVVVSSLIVVLGLPLWLAIAGAIRLSSPGPVFYRDRRIGLNERDFPMMKFRTMYPDAAERQAALEASNEASGPLFKIKNDPRVTSVGRMLRRYSLDEVPQVLNVLRGQMSLVGPRPLPLRDYVQLEPWHRKRHLVLPGMTGLWQVSGRIDLTFDDLVRLDFYYLENWSIWLDISILAKTLPAVLARRGAY
jgi:exopolysaccharide biosynthesis polyprenyl glycosylphosphotransferase